MWPPRTPLTEAAEERERMHGVGGDVHPLLRVRDTLRALDAATMEDTKTLLRELGDGGIAR